MEDKKEPSERTFSAKKVDPQRARALDIAFMATRLLDEKYFDEVAQAVKTNNNDQFLKTCADAQVNPDIANALWELLKAQHFILGGW